MSKLYFHLKAAAAARLLVADGWQIKVSNLRCKSTTFMLIWWAQIHFVPSQATDIQRILALAMLHSNHRKANLNKYWSVKNKIISIANLPARRRRGRIRFVGLTEAERLAQTIISERKLRFPQSLLPRLPIASYARGLDRIKLYWLFLPISDFTAWLIIKLN